MMIWTIKIELRFGMYAKGDWEATVEVDSTYTLEDLHFLIQDLVEFDDDHLYGFYISRSERSRNRIYFDDENEKIYTTTLENLFPLGKDKRLFYLFDYGDSWLFKISKTRKKPKSPEKDQEYPILVEMKGEIPAQYPDYGEEW